MGWAYRSQCRSEPVALVLAAAVITHESYPLPSLSIRQTTQTSKPESQGR
jgi:hypothetical protein